jgi:hypothetical protein
MAVAIFLSVIILVETGIALNVRDISEKNGRRK